MLQYLSIKLLISSTHLSGLSNYGANIYNYKHLSAYFLSGCPFCASLSVYFANKLTYEYLYLSLEQKIYYIVCQTLAPACLPYDW